MSEQRWSSAMASVHPLEGFDPLATDEMQAGNLTEILRASQKRDVLNVLRSYTGTLDLFSGSIQNAIDAVDLR